MYVRERGRERERETLCEREREREREREKKKKMDERRGGASGVKVWTLGVCGDKRRTALPSV